MIKESSSWGWAIPDWLLERKDLDFGEKIMLTILGRLGALEKPVYPSQKWLAEKMGISVRQVKNILRKLQQKELIEKTGKIWKLNTYIIRGKDFPLSGEKISPDSGEKISPDKREIHSREIHKEYILYATSDEVAGSVINELIDLFKNVNPTYKRLFKNKTEREAVKRLVKEFGKEKVAKLIKSLPSIITKPYAPRITTPYQLEKKLADLIAFIQQERSAKSKYQVGKV